MSVESIDMFKLVFVVGLLNYLFLGLIALTIYKSFKYYRKYE